MELKGDSVIAASRHRVWNALNDPEILARCISTFDELMQQRTRIVGLPVGVRVGRGDAPATGFETMAETVKTTASLAALQTALGPARDDSTLLSSLGKALLEVVPSSAMVVYQVRDRVLHSVHTVSAEFAGFAAQSMKTGEGLSGWVAENGKSIINGNPAVEPGYLADPSHYGELRAAMAVPVIAKDGLIGVVALYRTMTDSFAGPELEALVSLAPTFARILTANTPEAVAAPCRTV